MVRELQGCDFKLQQQEPGEPSGGLRALDLGSGVLGVAFEVLSFEFGFRVEDFRFRVPGLTSELVVFASSGHCRPCG